MLTAAAAITTAAISAPQCQVGHPQACVALHPGKGGGSLQMPVVAAGTWQYDTADAQKSVTAALSVGVRHIDAAHDYCADGSTGACARGSNGPGIAAAVAASGLARSQLWITTKVPGCGAQGIGFDTCAADSLAAAEKNLEELQTAYVDLLLVHFPPNGGCGPHNCAAMRAQWKALSTLLDANKTRALGVSNWCVSCFKCLADGDADAVLPSVNQVKFHIGMGADPEGLLSYVKSAGIVLQAYSPLGDNTHELISGPLVTRLGAAHFKTGVQAALKWIWQHGVAVTTKSLNATHLAQDLDLFTWSLSADEMAEADASATPPGTPSFMCKA